MRAQEKLDNVLLPLQLGGCLARSLNLLKKKRPPLDGGGRHDAATKPVFEHSTKLWLPGASLLHTHRTVLTNARERWVASDAENEASKPGDGVRAGESANAQPVLLHRREAYRTTRPKALVEILDGVA